jgi:hypothetical protein
MSEKKKKHYAKYVFVRGNQALWRGDAAEAGAQFRQVVITSDEWMLIEGTFQVYALEGISKGIVKGKFDIEPEPKLLFDKDFKGLEKAAEKFKQLIKEAESQGFKAVGLFEAFEFQAKLQASAGEAAHKA